MDDAVRLECTQTFRHRFVRHVINGKEIPFRPLCGIRFPCFNMFAFSKFHLLDIAELVFELILCLKEQLHIVKPRRSLRGVHDRPPIHHGCIIWNDSRHFNLLPIECADVIPDVFGITSNFVRRANMRVKSCAVIASLDVFAFHPATHDIAAARLDGERPPELHPRWNGSRQNRRHDGFFAAMRDRVRPRIDMLLVCHGGTPSGRRDFIAVFEGIRERLQRRHELVGQLPRGRIVPIEP